MEREENPKILKTNAFVSHKHIANNVTQVLESYSDQQSAYNVVDKHKITDMRDISRKRDQSRPVSVLPPQLNVFLFLNLNSLSWMNK